MAKKADLMVGAKLEAGKYTIMPSFEVYAVRIGTSLGKKYIFHKSNHLSTNARIKREMKKLFTFDMIA